MGNPKVKRKRDHEQLIHSVEELLQPRPVHAGTSLPEPGISLIQQQQLIAQISEILGSNSSLKKTNNGNTSLGKMVLQGWKAIARELDRGVRTVQRWERTLALPVHRIGGKSHGQVVAFADELRSWLETAAISEFDRSNGSSPSISNPKSFNSKSAANIVEIGGSRQIESPDTVIHFRDRRALTTCDPRKTSCERCLSSLQPFDAVLSASRSSQRLKVRLHLCPICDFDLSATIGGTTSLNRGHSANKRQTTTVYNYARQ